MRYRRLEKNVKLILGRRKDINRVIVTGVAGFTGSAVARHIILDTPDAVCVVDKLTCAGNLKKLTPIANDPRFKFEKVDICNKTKLDRGALSSNRLMRYTETFGLQHKTAKIMDINVFRFCRRIDRKTRYSFLWQHCVSPGLCLVSETKWGQIRGNSFFIRSVQV